MPVLGVVAGYVLVGVLRKESGWTIFGEQAQPTGKVSPTTAHCGSPKRQSILPRSWMKPVAMNQRGWSSRADRFRGLQRVLDLREVGVGIAVVHQRVQEVERLPDVHLPPVERQVLALLRPHEIERLVRVVQAIELFNPRVGLL